MFFIFKKYFKSYKLASSEHIVYFIKYGCMYIRKMVKVKILAVNIKTVNVWFQIDNVCSLIVSDI